VPLPGLTASRPLLGAVLGFLSALPIVAVHEAGHLLAGHLVGLRLVWCRVGPLGVLRTPRGLRVVWTGMEEYDSGEVGMVPADEERFRWRYAWTIAGGLLASLALTVLLAGAALSPWSSDAAWSGLRVGLVLLAVLSAIPLLVSVVPSGNRPWSPDSDG